MSPLSLINDIVAHALTGYTPLTAIVPAERIQVWDRAVDIRGQVEEATDTGNRIWIIPMPSPTHLAYSSGSVLFERNYQIGFGTGKMTLEPLCDTEYWISQALLMLFELQQPDGTPIVQPDPLHIQSIEIGSTDPERGPLLDDPQEWENLIGLSVKATALREALHIGPG